VFSRRRQNQLFGLNLGRAVDGEGIDLILLIVAAAGTVEDHVSRDQNKARLDFCGRFEQGRHCGGIDRARRLRIALAGIQIGIGRRVQDDVRTECAHQGQHGFAIAQIDGLGAGQRMGMAEGGQGPARSGFISKMTAEEAARAGQKHGRHGRVLPFTGSAKDSERTHNKQFAFLNGQQ